MKEKPIIFSTEMVRAILDGRKTQTRRVIKDKYIKSRWHDAEGEHILAVCPYEAGDRLWVRETWVPSFHGLDCLYKADEASNELFPVNKWKPSIHMPRWASRINLKITEVRAERINDISTEDCMAEGLEQRIPYEGFRYRFRRLWDSINAKRGYSWESNPWVWVIEFKRAQ